MSRVRRATAIGVALGVVAVVTIVSVVALLGRPTSDPFGRPLDIAPDSFVAESIAADDSLTPTQRAALAEIAAQPLARWITAPTRDVAADVRAAVAGAAKRSAIALLVAYAIPDRDCGGHSSGSLNDARGYEAWVDEFVAGLGAERAIIVVEPDALAQLDCLDAAARDTRITELRYAVDAFAAQGSVVYLDAGHSGWVEPAEMADRLERAGVAHARGFSLNVSNFKATDAEITYGESLVRQLGGDSHFVIDTSRNGARTVDSEWCNPPDRALGASPTTQTDSPLADAYLWIKTPGRSDGPCNGGPSAGVWWSQYAVDLVLNARRD